MQHPPNFLEAANALAQLGEFSPSGVGAAAAVEQAVDRVHDRAKGAQLRLPSADALQRLPFAVCKVMPHAEVAMIEEVADFAVQLLPSACGLFGCLRARSAARQDRLLGGQLFAHLGGGPQHGLGQFLEDVELTKLMPDRPANLGNRLGIEARSVGRDRLGLQATLLQNGSKTLEERHDVGVGGIVVQHLVRRGGRPPPPGGPPRR